MALSIATYPNPTDPNNPLADAYCWITTLTVDSLRGSGTVVLQVHPNEAAWQGVPLDRLTFSLGEQLTFPGDGSEPVRFATLGQLMADPDFAAAFATVVGKLYETVAATPAFAGNAEVV